MEKNLGRLFLIPNLIAPGNPADALPGATLAAIKGIRRYVVEGEKAAWKLLAAVLEREELDATRMEILDEHTKPETIGALLAPALGGEDLGLLSEAGMPCVADPGAPLVALAHDHGIRVIPLPGPSSIFLALSASGLDGQRFRFLGYLPQAREGRLTALRDMDRGIHADGATRIFIETPYRNANMLEDCLAALSSGTRLCVASELGSPAETIRSASVADWRSSPTPIAKAPAIFLAGRVPSTDTRNDGGKSENRRRRDRPEKA
ncbi:MAG TPA: SAM-dependent methyltransferase [Rectinemataceae bacterium]|nr:SAM-dependent methyltransferase [Rectinemataceae bacterium]